ncbi:MAG: serine protein kinase PrkA [Deltaproteobacteria bacterium]|nr:serine protein kinase PrkA [Deltaproteobacteria bacterium]
MSHEQRIQRLADEIQAHYSTEGQPLGFEEYLRIFFEQPTRQLRGAAHYIRDTFDYFGTREIQTPAGNRKRFRLFDAAFQDGVGRVAGQEEPQGKIYRLLENFVRTGRVNRLILLHGPNGSAKTSIIRAIVAGMEHYSSTEEGSLYHYRWIFPSEEIARGQIGFGDAASEQHHEQESYAHLPAEAIDAVLPCGMKDHPLLLVPIEKRLALFEQLRLDGCIPEDFTIPDVLLRGDLCPQCRKIHDALLAAYSGDCAQVLRHVQVQRLILSGRYRRGVATVEPQLHVDAGEQQMTASRDLSSLPPAIAHLNLFGLAGPLVDANRGLLEYNDLLKRPIDSFKYLLVTCESGQVTLDRSNLFLDAVILGSTNEMMLESFKSYADFASFKGRLELVRVPYLRRTSDENQIYTDQVPAGSLDRHLAPHTLELASLWAVMTRLRRPDPSGLESKELKQAVRDLNPLEKALLYDRGEAPGRLSSSAARELVSALADLYEWPGQDYEGISGASAREVRMLLMNAAQAPDKSCVTPLGMLAEIRNLMKDKTVFAFLQRKPEGDYMDQDKILDLIEEHYLDILEEEAAEAMGLVAESSYRNLLDRYISHVNAYLKKESLLDPVTRKSIPADEKLMKEVESVVKPDDEDEAAFRKQLISQIGAFALEAGKAGAPVGKPDYAKVFPRIYDRLKDDFVEKRETLIRRNFTQYLAWLDKEDLDARDEQMARQMNDSLVERFGYCRHCAAEALSFLMSRRFKD